MPAVGGEGDSHRNPRSHPQPERELTASNDEPWVERLIEAGLRLEAAFGFDGSELSTTFSVSGFPDGWLDVARNLSLGELRAPAELLPADTLIWIAASLDRERLSGLLRAEPEIASELLGGADAEVVEELAMAVGSEVGVAVIGLPEPREAAADAWLDRLVFYLRVEPKAAKRFLRRAMDGSRSAGGATVYHRGELHAVHVGEYLALATDDGVLGELGRGPGLDTTAFYGEVVTRSLAEVTVVGGLHVDLFARRLLDLLPADSEHGGSRLSIEALRALGPIVVWSGRRGERLEGRISLRPDLHTEAAREQVRRLVGYVGYLAGSIPLDGFRSELETDSIEQLELEIELADADWPLTAADRDDGADRLRLTRSAPGRYKLISTAAAALPERSGLVLPIEASHLAPYLRPERGLGVRERQIEDLAAEIRGDAQDPAEVIRRILEWVAENLEYQPVSGTESNEETLTSRQADCTEFTALTVALCRSLGIPARTVHGAGLLPDGSVAILHRWAEVYLDRWYEIDPTAGQARVPASTLRLASSDATALVSTPGSRLRLQALRSVDGGLARRLAEVPGADHRGRVEIAVDGDDVLIAYADPPLEGTASGLRVLRSADRGERFAAIATATPPSELGELIGGHGKLLWLAGDGDRETRLYSLDESGGWEDLTAGIRQELRRGLEVEPHRWSMATLDDGFLVLAHGDQPRAALLGPDLGFQRQLPHPPGVDEPWVLGPDRPVVAHRTADGGVALSEWDDGAWTNRVVFSDARGLEPRRLRTAGPRIELVCHDPGRDRQTLLWWSADTDKHNRTTPKEGVPIHDSVTVGSWIWDAWRDDGALIFSRRPSARASLGPAGTLLD